MPANNLPATLGRGRSASDLCSRHGNFHARCLRIALAALATFGAMTLAARAETFAQRLAPCLACHGEQGQSSLPTVPSLGAQPAPYLLIQLYLFRGRQRLVEVMNEASKDFSDDDLRTFSDSIAKLPAPRPADGEPADPARIDRGQALVRQYRCDFCHSPDLAGRDNIPRLAGQREDYLIKAMREYKSNARPGYDASMADVLARISDAEILDLAYFAARQP
ncbi:MAG TPA: cytochrome C [Hyphomicrobiaceae bacterium]|nr:cytochrome C [Hyphomicrobiaceae bacterium]